MRWCTAQKADTQTVHACLHYSTNSGDGSLKQRGAHLLPALPQLPQACDYSGGGGT